jgi:hypothetical protein
MSQTSIGFLYGGRQDPVNEYYIFHVKALKIGLVQACVIRYSRRERRDGAESAEVYRKSDYFIFVSASHENLSLFGQA